MILRAPRGILVHRLDPAVGPRLWNEQDLQVLTLTFLGVGSAYAKRNFQSNALIEAWAGAPDVDDGPVDVLLVDFGTTGPLALHQLKNRRGFSYLNRDGQINYRAVSRVLVTHLHGDHVGGLEELAGMTAYFQDRDAAFKPELIGDRTVLEALWDQSLRGGLGAGRGGRSSLDDYFRVTSIDPRGEGDRDSFDIGKRYAVSIFRTDHIRRSQKHDWPSFGLLIRDRETQDTAFYSGDTRFDLDAHGEMIRSARIVFHEAQLLDDPNPVHTLLSDLRTLPETVRQRMFLYHYDDTWDDSVYSFVSDEFAGFAEPQRRYTLFA